MAIFRLAIREIIKKGFEKGGEVVKKGARGNKGGPSGTNGGAWGRSQLREGFQVVIR